MPTFTVDTHVFRELGELLVGRDSTALIELIKNAYDADATQVVVHGENLSDIEIGKIVVVDDGVGMAAKTFSEGFLRIASRSKDEGNRRSKRFKRRYTGAKGIGRLAAHKLARILEVESFTTLGGRGGVSAKIDWDRVESKETLDEVASTSAITVDEVDAESRRKQGTRITLRRLRRRWTVAEHARFMEEVQSFGPPKALRDPLPPTVVTHKLLFESANLRDSKLESHFEVRLEGELAPPDEYWTAVVEAAHWILEVDATSEPGVVHYCISPTNHTRAELPQAKTRRFAMPHPGGRDGPQFQARVLIRTGKSSGDASAKAWSARASGVRVYMEGFRVLPYGEKQNDWLGLDRDYADRSDDALDDELQRVISPKIPSAGEDRPGLLVLPNKNFFGAVFLTQECAPTLRMLVNREGFVPDAAYDQLVRLVKTGISLTTRVRAVSSVQERIQRREDRSANLKSSAATEIPTIVAAIAEAHELTVTAKRLTSSGDVRAAAKQLDSALSKLSDAQFASDSLDDERSMLRVLASIGTQMSSFIHELNGLLGMSEVIEKSLRSIAADVSDSLPRKGLTRLRETIRSVADLRRHLERQASYLIDVVSVDARRKRSRQGLQARFDSATRIVQGATDRLEIDVVNKIPSDLKSPPMFPAELTTVFSNLLTNAIKAAGANGKIRASGKRAKEGVLLRIENSGVAVKLSQGERWFKPFESSTADVDPILGQGMGLGLTITRAMLDGYGATIAFVKPSPGYSTAVEIEFSG
jgi:signal transduction histidine kinase